MSIASGLSASAGRRSLLLVGVCLAVLLSSCTSEKGRQTGGADARSLAVVVANHELAANVGNRFLLGLVLADGRQVAYGQVQVQLRQVVGGVPASPGPVVLADYLPLFGTNPGDPNERPRGISPSSAKGVYVIRGVRFTAAGTYQVGVAADVRGIGMVQGSTSLEVLPQPAVPAPGDPAPMTQNLTLADLGSIPVAGIESRAATNGGKIPDPELHRQTIAGAIASHRPALVVFSTPVYCVSRFCGPVTQLVQKLASRYAGPIAFIHVEIWKDFQKQDANQAAIDWLYRNGSLKEPWLFLIGSDGKIAERWDNVFAPSEVEPALRRMR